MATKPKAAVKKTVPKKAAPNADPNLFNQPAAKSSPAKAPSIAKPKYTIKGNQVSRNLPALRSSTSPAVIEKAKSLPAKSLASKLGSAAGKLKGKGKIGLAAGLLAAGAAGAYSAYNRGTGTTKKKAAETPTKDAAPVSILKGVNRRDEIGKPSSPMVLKSSTASAPKSEASTSPKVGGGSTKTVGSSKSSTGKVRVKKPATFSRGKAITLSGKTEGLKSQIPVGKTAVVKNVSFASTAPKSKVYEKATKKGARMEKRSERKASRMDKRETRVSNRMEKIKSKR
jgi:hypothetical protein